MILNINNLTILLIVSNEIKIQINEKDYELITIESLKLEYATKLL